jgi:ankyrin repeat protein
MPNGATSLMLAAGMDQNPEESRRGIAVIDFGKVEPEPQVLEAVKTALNLSGDVTAANQAGDTALHAAAIKGYGTVVQFLADHGAQVNAKNNSGLTPLAAVSAPAKRKYLLAGAAGAASGGDSTGEDPAQLARQRTAALLRKLGATE